ncbi:MAG: hypothetical protein V4596_09010 [Bdellovibrionota bacterium]
MRINKTHFNNKSLYTCLIFISFSLIALKSKEDIRHVKNLEDFKVHTQTHAQNVYTLGMYLYNEYKETHFKNVPEHVLIEKLRMHDYEKLASVEDLRDLGYKNKLPFADRLYNFFGQNKYDSVNSKKIKALIQELNFYAKQYDEAVLKKHGLLNVDGTPNSIGQLIILIEKIADIVEREKNPITPEEIGIKKARKASAYLNGLWAKNLAENLAGVYHQIVQPNPLIYSTRRHPRVATCAALFN